MSTTHVFIVDDTTFKIHLEYMFAGTGGNNTDMSFLTNLSEPMHYARENNVMAMIADANRIRENDNIIFYLQQTNKHEGRFFGIFKAVHNFSFLENHGSYLYEQLQKRLTFRTLIKPYKVYQEGITEWNLLDNISHIDTPDKMFWSLIYRKLKGNRGNTMITLYEAKQFESLLPLIPGNRILESRAFSFDEDACKIIPSEIKPYLSGRVSMNVFPRMKDKYDCRKVYEYHLQAYIVKNIDRKDDLRRIILDNKNLEWLGNEVSCGVGMQRIDIVCAYTKDDKRFVVPIELKAVEVYPNIVKQIKRYVDWIKLYYQPNNEVRYIQPVVIAPKCINKNSKNYVEFIQKVQGFNQQEGVLPIKYIEFFIDNDIHFNNIDY